MFIRMKRLSYYCAGDPVNVIVDASVMSFGKLDTLNMVCYFLEIYLALSLRMN